ncbi:4-oxalomesaconate tautomerase [Rhodobacteraceae bacterium RKSG542]|uniref:4-oxalomesaconate tautomerase n=1 Tax=Pseudovibrio flavus TaxID=2529854 RepID=UPI0012BB6774|nr:4-oxalomesaconate tautomerase [Pseudovibrio flavus]MTI18104.1 4-oxalomesaconate tautomerase [Pseudovibrio flavus]
MTQTQIPYVFMRGGTSRGPYFNRADLPEDRDTLSKVLVATVGSGHPLNIDGMGGGAAVTTKVAMLSRSDDEWADIDYFFAQLEVEGDNVDYKPTCGNILAGVGPAAVEMGLIEPVDGITEVKIRAVNTGARVVALVNTPKGALQYGGETEIAGVPGSAAAVNLLFQDVAGSVTGSFLPTGNLIDVIEDIPVTCMDVAMPVVIASPESFGLTGLESAEELDNNREFFTKMERIRCKAGEMMGMGDVSQSVVPKFGLLAKGTKENSVAARYFMPKKTHPSMAVTGGQCMACCVVTPGTVAQGLVAAPNEVPATIVLEHPSGTMDVILDYEQGEAFKLRSAGIVRTARKLADGYVYVEPEIWQGPQKG